MFYFRDVKLTTIPMVDKQNRELFLPLPSRLNRNDNSVQTFYAKTVVRGPSFEAKLHNNEGNMNMNEAVNTAVRVGIAAKQIYDNNPNVQNAVNKSFSRIVKPVEQNYGSGKGYLSEAPNPAQTSLNTGIKLTIQEKNYTQASENVCAPLHTTHALFNFPLLASSQVYNWFTLISTRDFQTRVQENVNWAVDIQTKFSAANITTAMNALFKALQVYYFYRSVDTYCRGGFNQNDGMYAIQAEFDFNTRMKLAEIARLLSRSPIPPNMLSFTRYINTCYYSGESPGSSLLLIVPFPKTTGTPLTSNTNLDNVITDLSNSTYIDVWNTLGRAMKSWVPGDPANLFDPPIEPCFDRDYLTIFNNLPFSNGITGKTYSPNTPDVYTSFSYMSWNNNLDGIAVALTDSWNTTTSAWNNGLVTPQVFNNYSRYSYYAVAGVKGWYAERAYSFLQNSRLDTYLSDGTTATAYHRFGSDMVINISPLMISTTAINTIDFWLSKDLIKGTNVQRDDNPRPARPKRKPKDKKK